MPKLSNIRTVSIPSLGKLPLADDPGTFTHSGVKREHKAGRLAQDGGFTETETPATLEANVNMLPGLDVAVLNAVEDQDITVRLSNGEVWLMSQASSAECVAISDGTTKVTFFSNTSERI